MGFQFPVNSSPAAGAHQSTIAFPAPQLSQHMRSVPASNRRPVPGQPHDHAGVVRDAVVSNSYCDILQFTRTHMPVVFQVPPANAASDHLPDGDREDMLPPVENSATQGQPQDLWYGGMGHYGDIANNHLQVPLHEHHDHAVNDYAGLALDVPAQAQAAPLAPVCPSPPCSAYTYLTRHFPEED
jgi:hypothetical protein